MDVHSLDSRAWDSGVRVLPTETGQWARAASERVIPKHLGINVRTEGLGLQILSLGAKGFGMKIKSTGFMVKRVE